MGKGRKKRQEDAEDIRDMKPRGRRKKQKKKAKRHFDKDALRGIMNGTIDVDAYQDYVDKEQ
ncbi:hypothetical protein CL614_09895 [archaeon]|nr:hypothetical protein [archaeon]|tara:strand:+ start:691 stop:876 length:186 start_codon:yes stop_codon:yes gene_type:complete